MDKIKQLNEDMTRRRFIKYSLYTGLLASMSPGIFGGCSQKKTLNVILITLDTTRADHLSCYGYHRQTSPNLDKLAEESVVYTKAIAPSSWTLPSHASLFTGKFTSSHGAQYDSEGPLHLTDAIHAPKAWQVYRARGLAQNEITLAEILHKVGYSTGAVVGGPWMKKVFGLNKGFEHYDDDNINSVNGRSAKDITDKALKWIKTMQDKNFFLFLNYFDPHFPYNPPSEFALSFLKKNTNLQGRELNIEGGISLYDAEILYMDHYIGKLLQTLKSLSLYDNTMIVVTADHGELFGEHGIFGHGLHLYQEEIHVPLFIKYPGHEISPIRTDTQIQLNDIMAIILKCLGLPMPHDVQAGVPPQIGHPLMAEVYPLPVLSSEGHWRAIFDKESKFVWNSNGNHQLFDLKKDPHEKSNLIGSDAELTTKRIYHLNKYLASLPGPGPASAPQALDENTKKALKSLGYIE